MKSDIDNKIRWADHPTDYTLLWMLGALLTMVCVLGSFVTIVLAVVPLFALVIGLNIYFFANWENNFGLDDYSLYITNKVMKWRRKEFKITEISKIELSESPIRGNMRFKMKVYANGKCRQFIFQKQYGKDLVRLGELMALRGIEIKSNLRDVEYASNPRRKMFIFATLIPTLIIIILVIVQVKKSGRELDLLRETAIKTIGTTAGLGELNHGQYRVRFTYEVAGKSYQKESLIMVWSESKNKNPPFYLDSHQHYESSQIEIPIEIQGGKYLVLFAPSNPIISRIIFEEKVDSENELEEIELKGEWLE